MSILFSPDLSPNLSLPLLLPSQAQKHVTHNEALLVLDALVQLKIAAFDLNAPPAVPASGAVYAIGHAPTDAFAGYEGALALWDGAGWLFFLPREGWQAWSVPQGMSVVFQTINGQTAWRPVQGVTDEIQGLSRLGVGANADDYNQFSVASDAALLSHKGAGHQLKINKAHAGETATILFQSDWAGRAEMGLAGDDTFRVKVSADGANYVTGLELSATNGALKSPAFGTYQGTAAASGTVNMPLQGGGGMLAVTCKVDGIWAHGIYGYGDVGDALRALVPSGEIDIALGGGLTGNTGAADRITLAVENGQLVVENTHASDGYLSVTLLSAL